MLYANTHMTFVVQYFACGACGAAVCSAADGAKVKRCLFAPPPAALLINVSNPSFEVLGTRAKEWLHPLAHHLQSCKLNPMRSRLCNRVHSCNLYVVMYIGIYSTTVHTLPEARVGYSGALVVMRIKVKGKVASSSPG